jgi:hypothetical protein
VSATSPASITLPTTAASRLVVRRATAQDDAGRRALLGGVAMETDLSLSIRRAPTVDALYALHGRAWEGWVVADERGAIEGMGSVVVRDGFLDGAVEPVGYLGDLRFSQRAEGRHLLDRAYGLILREASERYGCRYYLTAIIASNARARRALTVHTERAARRGRPRYTLVREFDIRSLHLVLPRRRTRSAYAVRIATPSDIPAIAALLDADARRRPLGYPMPEHELRRRLAAWPGLRAESFHVAEDRAGTLVGAVAPWDASPVKQTVIESYGSTMARVRSVHDVAARLLRRPTLPQPGAPLAYRYLTHLAVPSGNPAILRALLESAHAEARRDRMHFLSACAPVNDALEAGYRGFLRTDIRAGLYVVTLPETPVPDALRTGPMPGFEMALV